MICNRKDNIVNINFGDVPFVKQKSFGIWGGVSFKSRSSHDEAALVLASRYARVRSVRASPQGRLQVALASTGRCHDVDDE
jgi:hypothetical protein